MADTVYTHTPFNVSDSSYWVGVFSGRGGSGWLIRPLEFSSSMSAITANGYSLSLNSRLTRSFIKNHDLTFSRVYNYYYYKKKNTPRDGSWGQIHTIYKPFT